MADRVYFRLLMRRNFRRQRILRDRTNPFDVYGDVELFARFRFRREDVITLVDLFGDELEHPLPRGGSLPPLMQVLVALRFFATGGFQRTIGDLFKIDRRTVARVIDRFSSVLSRRLGEFVRLPVSQREADVMKDRFYQIAGFPNVLGCIDCTHIPIIAPVVNEFEYVNRKGKHTINVQLICNADMVIINCIVRWPGSVHDSRILRESNLFRNFEGPQVPLQGVFLGDSGYMLRPWLFTPILNPDSRAQHNYNAAHCSTRSGIERTNGVLKRRWHCLHDELRYVIYTTLCVCVCVCVVFVCVCWARWLGEGVF